MNSQVTNQTKTHEKLRKMSTSTLNINFKSKENKFFKDAETTVKIYKMEFSVVQKYASVYLSDLNGCILAEGYVDGFGELWLHKISDKLYYFGNVKEVIIKALKLKK